MPDISTGLAQAAAAIVQANQSRAEAKQRAQLFAIQAASAVSQIEAQKAQVEVSRKEVELKEKELVAKSATGGGDAGVASLEAGLPMTEAQLKLVQDTLAARHQLAQTALLNQKMGAGPAKPKLSDLKSVRAEVRAAAASIAEVEVRSKFETGTPEQRALFKSYAGFDTQRLATRMADLSEQMTDLKVRLKLARDPAQQDRIKKQLAPLEAEANAASTWQQSISEARARAKLDPETLEKAGVVAGFDKVLFDQAFNTASDFNQIRAIRTFTDPQVFLKTRGVDVEIDNALQNLVSGDQARKEVGSARLLELMLRTTNYDEAKAAASAFLDYSVARLGRDTGNIPPELSDLVNKYGEGLKLQGK